MSKLTENAVSQEEYEHIKEALSGHFRNPRLSYKYLLLIKVLRNTGLRIAEVLRCGPEHLQLNGSDYWLVISRGTKRGKSRPENVAIHPELGMELAAHVKGNDIRPGNPIFGFRARELQKVFGLAAQKALGRRATPHALRGLYTTTLIDGGVPLGAAAKLLGHEDERTTLRHYYELSAQRRAEIARKMPI